MDDLYTVKGKSLDELVDDLETLRVQGSVGAGSYELIEAAIAAKAANATIWWARIAAVAAGTSAMAAIAAVLVAVLR